METETRTLITVDDLIAQGFTPEQIARLVALRNDYPLVEAVGSQRELDRLRFLKWRYATGHLQG